MEDDRRAEDRSMSTPFCTYPAKLNRTRTERGRDDFASAIVYSGAHNALEKSLEANRRTVP